jgi:RarD protein
MWICGAWVYVGAQTTVAVNISLIYSVSPVLVVLVSVVWLKERVTRLQALGVVLALAGVLHIVLKGAWLNLAQVAWVPGDLWILAATLAWTVYSILLKRWASPLNASARLAVIALFGVAVMLPFTAWEAAHTTHPIWSAEGALLVLAAALFPGYGAYLAFSVMQRELGAARAGLVLYLGPLYAAVIAWPVLNEPLGLYHLIGAALILPGIWLANRK